MGQVEPGHPTGFGHIHLEPRVVARGRADVADPGDNSRGAGQIHGIVEQVSELEAQTVVIPVAAGCCEDRWCVSSHVETIGGRHRRAAAVSYTHLTLPTNREV